VILYDPAYYPTYTGDGEIVFQFADLADVDGNRMYSTCGIQNGDHTDGITFAYYARRPATATTYNEPLAIKFTTAGPEAADVTPRPTRLFFLGQNEPNPCQSATSFRFGLEREAPVVLRIFDVDGRLVRTLWQGRLSGGEHTLEWGGHSDQGHLVPAGVYFYTLQADEQTATRKMLRLR
jgi:hypothetical protein